MAVTSIMKASFNRSKHFETAFTWQFGHCSLASTLACSISNFRVMNVLGAWRVRRLASCRFILLYE